MIGSRVKWVDPGQQKKSSKSQSKLDPWHFIHRRTQNSNQLVMVEWSSGPLRKKENKLMDHKIQIARSLSVCLSPSFLCLTTAPAFLFHRRLFLSSLGCSCWLFPCKWFPYQRRVLLNQQRRGGFRSGIPYRAGWSCSLFGRE
jgi:hypothetical protein